VKKHSKPSPNGFIILGRSTIKFVVMGYVKASRTLDAWSWLEELKDEFETISSVAMNPNERKSGINIGSDSLSNQPIAPRWAVFTDPLSVGEYPIANTSLGLQPSNRPLVLGGHDPQHRLLLFTNVENSVRHERLGNLSVVACQNWKVNIRDPSNTLATADGNPVVDGIALANMLISPVPEVAVLFAFITARGFRINFPKNKLYELDAQHTT
jgi:hypothetical protein